MTSSSRWGISPRQSIEAECARRGRDAVVDGCRALLREEDADPALLLALGGPPARKFLDGHAHEDGYWVRVWAARGLLWAWQEQALPELRRCLSDESWRVREMGLKVVARHRVDDLLEEVAQLRDDPVARVRDQAARCLVLLSSSS
ncbi:MAG: HEAT repeat domain-containing protein [Motilibacteraceae bacterium]